MKLYREGTLICFKDGDVKFHVFESNIDISESPTGSNIADMTFKRINSIVKRTKAVSEIFDINGDVYGTTVDDVVNAIESTPKPVSTQFGVPNEYTKQTTSSKSFDLQKGQLNNFRIRQQIINEHVETSRQLQSTVTSTNIVGQVFKASQDNINGISLTLQSGETVDFDDFESYADDAALQAAWIASNGAYLALLETSVVYEGTKSMDLSMSAGNGDEWARTFTSVDFTGWTGTFQYQCTHVYSQSKLRVFVEDSLGNSNSGGIVHQDINVWEFFEFEVASLTPDGGTPADTSDIVKIGFRLEARRNLAISYIDDMISFEPPGSVDVELWDMGTTIPISGATSIDDGTQYEELGDRGVNGGSVVSSLRVNLESGKRQYLLRNYVAGVALEIPDNTLLNSGNYYAIVLRYVDGDVNVFGSNTSYSTNYYNNGYAFTAPDAATAITALGEFNDLQFSVYSTQDAKINTLIMFFDDVPGNDSRGLINVENKFMDIVEVVLNDANSQQVLEAEFKDRSLEFPKGGKFELNLNDDFTDSTSKLTLIVGYMFEPPTVNG